MKKIKTPSQKEKVEMYEGLLHDLQMVCEVTMNEEHARTLLVNICKWSYSHRAGEITDDERDSRINELFWKLRDK